MAKKSKKRPAPRQGIPASASIAATDHRRPPADFAPAWWENPAVRAAALVALVLLVYLPVWNAGFVWDDEMLTTGQAGASAWQNLRDIWTSSAADICPLTLTTFWLEHLCWGADPVPYHLVTLLMHALAAVLLWRVLRLMRIPGAWLGAALWAVHPVMVESVAWIAEMKNTQSGIFYLLSILFFLRSREAEGPARRRYLLSLVFAALALASKTSTAVLPGVLLLCAWWMDGRFCRRQLVRVAPILAMVALAALFSVWTQAARAANWGGYAPRGWPERLVTAGDVVWFYLGKLAWPHPLIILYPRWTIAPGDVLSWLPLAAALVVTAVLWRWRDGWGRPWFLAWSYFAVALLPVLGLIQLVYFQWSFVADHFQYLAAMGPLALLGAGLARMAAITGRLWTIGAGAVIVLALGALSCQRSAIYRDTTTFWNDLLTHPHEAEAEYRQAIALRPDSDVFHVDLGNALLSQHRNAEAIAEFRQALALQPGSAIDHYDLGNALMASNDWRGAEAEFRTAEKLNPGLADAHANLGTVLARRGDLDGAIAEFRQAVALPPPSGETYYDLAVLLLQKGRLDEAIACLQTAARLSPDNANITGTLARALAYRGPGR